MGAQSLSSSINMHKWSKAGKAAQPTGFYVHQDQPSGLCGVTFCNHENTFWLPASQQIHYSSLSCCYGSSLRKSFVRPSAELSIAKLSFLVQGLLVGMVRVVV